MSLDLGACALDPVEAGRAYAGLSPEGHFQRFVEGEGARRAVLGLQAQGLTVVLVTADRQGDNLSSFTKQDRDVDQGRLFHVQRHLSVGGALATANPLAAELELLRAARSRRCLVAVPSKRGLLEGMEGMLDVKPSMLKDMQVPYIFDEDGTFRFWLPQQVKLHLLRSRGTLPVKASPTGRLLGHLTRLPGELTQRPVSATPVRQRALEQLAPLVPPFSLTASPQPSAQGREERAGARHCDPVPFGVVRPLTVETSGCAKSLEFKLGLSARKGCAPEPLSPFRRLPLTARDLQQGRA